MATTTQPDFDVSKARGINGGGRAAAPAAAPKAGSQRLFVEVTNYETPSNAPQFVVGRVIDNPSQEIRVRLNTVAERLVDQPKDTEEAVLRLYAKGEKHRKTVADYAKDDVRLISFDDARLIGTNADGVPEFRAHWPKVMSTEPAAEASYGYAHVKLEAQTDLPNGKVKAPVAHVEMIRSNVVLSKDNVDEAMERALSITDDEDRPRNPIAILQLRHKGEVLTTTPVRIYPVKEPVQSYDQATGETKDVYRNVAASVTLASLAVAKEAFSDFATINNDKARAILAAVKGEPMPEVASKDERAVASIAYLHGGIAAGKVEVELFEVEQINFGPKAKSTYVKDLAKPQLAAYKIVELGANDTKKTSAAFMPTMIATQRHADGEKYAVFASPVEQFPRDSAVKFTALPVMPAPQMRLSSDAVLEAGAAADAAPVVEELVEAEPELATAEVAADDRYDSGIDDDIAF